MLELSLKVEKKAWGTYKSEQTKEVKKRKINNDNVFSAVDYNSDDDRYKMEKDEEVNIRNVAEILLPKRRKTLDEQNQQLRKDAFTMKRNKNFIF